MDYLELQELYHHGVKGQKWGVRRFQNEDGSLTSVGKKRKNAVTEIDKKVKDIDEKIGDSPLEKDFGEYKKKYGHGDMDDYSEAYSQEKQEKLFKEQEKWRNKHSNELKKRNQLLADRVVLDDFNYTKSKSDLAAVMSTMFLTPASLVISLAATRKLESGKARAAIVLGSAVGSIAIPTAITAIKSKNIENKTLKKYGI